MKVLQINTSIFGAGGESTRLAGQLAGRFGADIAVRDLAAEPVPHLDGARFAAFLADPEKRTPEQAAVVAYSDRLIGELRAADVLVLAVPMYNYGVPSTLRAYFDHIARAGITFKYTEQGSLGLLSGKKAYVVVTRGGVYGEDHAQAGYVREFLAFVGITDVTFVYAEGLALGEAERNAAIARAERKLRALPALEAIAA